MTEPEQMALALLRAGLSFGEASDRTRLPLEVVMRIWNARAKASAQ